MNRDTPLALAALAAGVTDAPVDRAWLLMTVDNPRIMAMKYVVILRGLGSIGNKKKKEEITAVAAYVVTCISLAAMVPKITDCGWSCMFCLGEDWSGDQLTRI